MVVLSWYFPNRWHFGELIGNNYANTYADALVVATDVVERLPQMLTSVVEWNHACLTNDLSVRMRDFLVNSVSTIAKTGIWSGARVWRQFESFSADDIDPVHIHLYVYL
jgi:uncharacterized protein (DUF608 family)